MITEKKIEELEARLEYTFKDKSLIELALSHSSYINEQTNRNKQCNERIEFLGDAILEMVSSEYLYNNRPQDKEGVLSKQRAALVCEKALATAARSINLGDYLLLGKGEAANGGANRDSILADAFEAVIGAIYLDGGYEVVSAFIIKRVLENGNGIFVDYKSRFQEIVQGRSNAKIVYELVGETGPEHDRKFEVAVSINGVILGHGTGHNKKSAEQNAAMEAIVMTRRQTDL
ncbi:MAG: ribonuclease III [Lachnospiraceae bacterium]|nr:ribonuclease III [Lachnospiraceae bacterium]